MNRILWSSRTALAGLSFLLAGTLATTSVLAGAGPMDKRLWPHDKVHYLVDPLQPWKVVNAGTDTLPSCADWPTVTCEQPWRDGVIAAIGEYERFTELDRTRAGSQP
jgi:hypothetical protein